MTRLLTTTAIAERWGCNRDKVLHFIRTGQLRAINLAMSDKRPRWYVEPGDLDTFETARQAPTPLPKEKPRRRLQAVKEFF